MTTWPGSMPTTPADLADAAAELVRAVNHTTRPGITAGAGGLGQIGDVYDTVAGLALLAARLPQAVAQLAAHVTADAADGRLIVVDETGDRADPGDTGDTVQAVTGRLNDAARAARVLAALLDDAQQALAVLGRS